MTTDDPDVPDEIPNERATIDFVILGDYAQHAGGKLTVVGAGWTLVQPVEYPVAFPFGLGIGFLIPWSETNRRHNFTFSITGEANVQVASGGGDVEAGRQPGLPAGMTQRAMIAVAGQLGLPGPGTYRVEVMFEGQQKVLTFQAMPVSGQRIVMG